MTAQAASASPFEIDVAPALRIYMDGLESWKESYEKFFQPGAARLAANQPAGVQAAEGQSPGEWQAFGAAWLQGMLQQQVELCRLYGRRMECYVELSDRIARSRTPTEFGEAQLDFLRRTIADYSQHGMRLAQSASAPGTMPVA